MFSCLRKRPRAVQTGTNCVDYTYSKEAAKAIAARIAAQSQALPQGVSHWNDENSNAYRCTHDATGKVMCARVKNSKALQPTWGQLKGETLEMFGETAHVDKVLGTIKWASGPKWNLVPDPAIGHEQPIGLQLPHGTSAADFEKAITVVTQCSLDRFPQLRAMAGSLSAHYLSVGVWFPCRLSAAKASAQIQALHQDVALNTRCGLQLTVCVGTGSENDNNGGYPINHLRNVALQRSNSDVVLLLDVDFRLNREFSEVIHKHYAELHETCMSQNAAFVLPSFESEQGHAITDSLAVMKAGGHANPFRMDIYKKGVFATDYSRWLKTAPGTHFQVAHQEGWEPYVMVARERVPLYDNRFVGYGYNKVQHILHLKHLGFSFHTLGGAFVIAEPHAPSTSRVVLYESGNVDENHRRRAHLEDLYQAFLSEMNNGNLDRRKPTQSKGLLHEAKLPTAKDFAVSMQAPICEPGMGRADQVSAHSMANSLSACDQACAAVNCHAFDFTEMNAADACRLYPRNSAALIGASGPQSRQFCYKPHALTQTDSDSLKSAIPVFWINLDREKERRAATERWLHGVPNTRIPAVTGKEMHAIVDGPHSEAVYDAINQPVEAMSRSERLALEAHPDMHHITCAITYSHLNAMAAAYESGAETALIMEDDNVFARPGATWVDVNRNMKHMIKNAPADWQVLQLFTSHSGAIQEIVQNKSRTPYFMPWNEYYGALAYLINRSGMKQIIDRFHVPAEDSSTRIWKLPAKTPQSDWMIYQNSKTYTSRVFLFNFANPGDKGSHGLDRKGRLFVIQQHISDRVASETVPELL